MGVLRLPLQKLQQRYQRPWQRPKNFSSAIVRSVNVLLFHINDHRRELVFSPLNRYELCKSKPGAQQPIILDVIRPGTSSSQRRSPWRLRVRRQLPPTSTRLRQHGFPRQKILIHCLIRTHVCTCNELITYRSCGLPVECSGVSGWVEWIKCIGKRGEQANRTES